MNHQTSKSRKLFGTCLLLVYVAAYALLAMWLGATQINHLGRFVQLLYYPAAGLAWIFPAYMILRWMSKPSG